SRASCPCPPQHGLPRRPVHGGDALPPDALRPLEHVQQPRAQLQPQSEPLHVGPEGGRASHQGGGAAAGRQQRRHVRRLRLRGRRSRLHQRQRQPHHPIGRRRPHGQSELVNPSTRQSGRRLYLWPMGGPPGGPPPLFQF
ncbi:unnamed protein product, partial [Tetraodon nigroviridis]